MNFSTEELFSMYGQYDKFVTLEFNYNSPDYRKFGIRLMGTFIYTLEERTELEKLINSTEIPRTDRKIKFLPSELEKLTEEQKIDLDKEGILASCIGTVYSSNLPNSNRFIERGQKDFQNIINVKAPGFSGWEELNRVRFGSLNSRHKRTKPLSPHETIQYFAFRKHYNTDLDKEDYSQISQAGKEINDNIRLEELRIKYQELSISEEELNEFVKLILNEIKEKNLIINREIERSTEKINAVSENYKTPLENLRAACMKFDETIISFGDKLIYLDFERFVHVFARHVADTQIGERFTGGNKTVFQYKFDDIISLIKMVIEHVHDEIQEHFKERPDQPYRRMGKRSIYFDGHYYRVEIDSTGSLKDFHPYNDDNNTSLTN